jgi:hypothetical protein
MPYPESAWERAMTVQEVTLKALSGELHWFRAPQLQPLELDWLVCSCRNMPCVRE